MTRWIFALAGVCLGWVPEVSAQEILLTNQLAGASAVRGNASGKTYDGFVVPSGLAELGGALVFITADERLGEPALDSTDVALARLQLRRALAPEVEVLATSSVLAKQRGDMDEPVWQSASLVSTLGLTESTGASAGLASGRLLDGAGLWWAFAPAFNFRRKLEKHPLHFSLSLGNVFTSLDYDAPDRGGFWMDELAAAAEVQIGEDEGGAWVGFDYSIPLAHARTSPEDPVRLDPPVRLGFELGAVWRPRRSAWDLFVSLQVVDRGELEDEATLLPILEGDFDQRQLTWGVQYRFEDEVDDDAGY